jgi:hypothetical protein
MLGVCALAVVTATGVILGRKLRLRGLAEWGTFGYTVTTSLLLGYGYLLSSGGLLGVTAAWLVTSVCGAVLAAVVCALTPAVLGRPGLSREPAGKVPTSEPGRQKPAWGLWLLVVPAGLTAVVVAGASLYLACVTAPHNLDSLSCHLARAAYFCQHGDLSNYPANHWGQTTHPRNQPILLVFAFLAGGENATQLVQFGAYLGIVVAVYGASRRLGARTAAAALAALLTAMWTNLIVGCRTTQNDLLIAAGVAVAVYCVLSFRQEPAGRYFWLSALALAGALGVKGSAALALPALGVLAGWAVWPYRRRVLAVPRQLVLALAGSFALLVLLLLPMGYALTAVAEGHPLGPAGVRQMHTLEGRPASQRVREIGKNALRFGIDMLSLDGLPPLTWLNEAQVGVREWYSRALTGAGINLGSQCGSLPAFDPQRGMLIMEDYSYAGVSTLLFVVPVLGYCLVRRSKAGPPTVMAATFGVFFLCQMAAGPYDPFRGRYFSWGAALVMPAVAACLDRWSRTHLSLLYLSPAVLLCCLSAISSILCSRTTPVTDIDLVTGQSVANTLKLDHTAQVTRLLWGQGTVVRHFEQVVPPDAVVAVSLPGGIPEYSLFGRGWTRKLLPVPPGHVSPEVRARAGLAQWLFFTSAVMPSEPTDLILGVDGTKTTYYLRRLR